MRSKDIKPMLATLAEGPFDDPAWVFEIKWDGYRLMVVIEKGNASLISRNGLDVSKKYPDICKAFAKTKKDAVIDGELVALDQRGMPSFQLMQHAAKQKTKLVFYGFDLLAIDGKGVQKETLLERKKLLKKVLPKDPHIKFSDHIIGNGKRFFEEAEKKGLEGVMAKRADSIYMSGKRSEAWLKIKTSKRQEAVVVGYTQPRNSRKYIGSLILAVRDVKEWKYVGHTGGSMGGKPLKEVYDLLQPLRTDKKQADLPRDVERNATWVKPKVLVELKFTEWTDAGTMRHPIVVGFRDDKPAAKVVHEKEHAVHDRGTAFDVSHPDKVYWPEEKITKGDVVEYYDRIADVILPYLEDRPMVLNRHPNGINKPGFFQKDSSELNLPEFVDTTQVHSESNDKEIRYVVVNNKETLRYVANLGCIELNPWNSRTSSIDRPDFYVIDLDPGDNTFDQVVEVAKVVHEVLELSCEKSFVKTSGKTGLHIYIPLHAKYEYKQVRSFAELMVRLVHERLPELTSLERSPAKRKKKIYLDWLQNRTGQTLAAPYSLRPWPGATVSTPLDWKEVKKGLDPGAFTIETIHKRLKTKGDLWKGVLGSGVDLTAAIKCLESNYGKKAKSK